jgi:hypothetical protein
MGILKKRFLGSISWDITPCSWLKVNRRFGVTYTEVQRGRLLQSDYRNVYGWEYGVLSSVGDNVWFHSCLNTV